MGQFSWFTQDSNRQIGCDKENRIKVYMFDNKGNKWTESDYDGYGVFGGKDYFDLLAEMNGFYNSDVEINRNIGIDLYYDKTNKSVLFPALYQFDGKFNLNKHDFKNPPDDDPNQGWYSAEDDGFEDEYYNDEYLYDDSDDY